MIGNDLFKAKEFLDLNLNVAIPTETVYGLAGNAFSLEAISSIFEIKQRPKFDPLIVHIKNINELKELTTSVDSRIERLINAFWPGPLTVLLPKSEKIPDLVTNGSRLCAFRIPNHSTTLELLNILEYPLVAPSANPFKYISPTTAQHVEQQLGKKVPYILNGGPCKIGLESTIVGIDNNQVKMFRKGGITIDALEKIVGPIHVLNNSTSNPQAPGMLSQHYSPLTKLILGNIEKLLSEYPNKRIGVLSYSKDYSSSSNVKKQFVLSPKKNLKEAARNLFKALRMLDDSDVDFIVGEYLPNEGLGLAINDRLTRASTD